MFLIYKVIVVVIVSQKNIRIRAVNFMNVVEA